MFNNVYGKDVFSINDDNNSVQSQETTLENITQSTSEMYNLDEFVETINNSVKENIGQEFELKNIANDILNKNNINYKNLILILVELFSK